MKERHGKLITHCQKAGSSSSQEQQPSCQEEEKKKKKKGVFLLQLDTATSCGVRHGQAVAGSPRAMEMRETRDVRGKAATCRDGTLSGCFKRVLAAPVQQQSLDRAPLTWVRAGDGSQGNPGWKGPHRVSNQTFCSKQDLLQYQTRLFCPFWP